MGMFPKSLRTKIFLITSVIIFILVSILFIFTYTADKKILYERQVIHMKENSFTIRNSIESVRIPMLFQSILEEYAENILRHKDSSHDSAAHDPYEISPHEIHIVNTESIVMASTKPELIGLPLENAIKHREEGLDDVLHGEKSYAVEQMEHLGVEVLDVSVPIRDSGTIIGALHYVEPYLKLEKLIRDSLIRHLVFALFLIISLSLIINLFLTKMVSDPINDLPSAMDGLRLKGQSNEIAVSSQDEIGVLKQSFNEMSKALKEREEELKKYTLSLEEMVDERTQKLRESNKQLVQTERLASMGKLAGYVSHEINNPIGIIFSRAECILMDAKEKGYPDFLKKDIEVIKKHADRIAKITKGMLTFSRKAPAEFSDIDLNHVIEETLLLLEKQFSDHSIDVHKNIDGDLPGVHGSSTQLQQVFLNILGNAIDAMPEGGEITIRSHCNYDESVNILISDSGSGIEREHLDKIFEPFFTTKTESKGTGLGLSVTYGIIKDHGGQITVQSKKGEGTTFEIQLPLKKNHFVRADI
jgi:signal transduction histidine kinase